jgi:lysophospholipase L1-like esterase
MRLTSVLFSLVVSCGMISPCLELARAQGFYLKAGDTVVLYGDSITQQDLYNQWVEFYTTTRFPSMRVHFYGAGVGGDRVTGGGGGTIDERLERDLFPHKPTVVTVMLGMNDGGYRTTTEEIEATYTKGFEHLLESIRAHSPGARITLLGPSPYDEVTRPQMFPGGYNRVLLHFADLDRDLAQKFSATFIGLNSPVVSAIQRAQVIDPLIAKMLLPDRVHPDPVAHWVMAEALLKGWNAPALVASVTIDARAKKSVDALNATIDQVERDERSLRWTATEQSLPLPFNRDNVNDALLLQISDIQQQLNQEPLRVTGLDAGQYNLTIDGGLVGAFSADDLQKGINLADYKTPMFSQAQRVGWLISDRDQAYQIHLRMVIRNADTGTQEGKPDLMDAFENSLEDAIYDAALPVPHKFSLTPVVAPPGIEPVH